MDKKQYKPTEAELEILNILWERGPSTVREIHDLISKQKEVGYTTTLKLMQIMAEKKGLLSRTKEGKTHTYHSNISKEQAQDNLIKRLMNQVFEGSATKLAMKALGNQKATKEELDEIRKYLDELENENQ